MFLFKLLFFVFGFFLVYFYHEFCFYIFVRFEGAARVESFKLAGCVEVFCIYLHFFFLKNSVREVLRNWILT